MEDMLKAYEFSVIKYFARFTLVSFGSPFRTSVLCVNHTRFIPVSFFSGGHIRPRTFFCHRV